MGVISTSLFFLITFLSYLRDKRWYAPSVLFPLFWAILALLSLFRFYNLFDTSNLAYFYVFIGVISYVVGCMMGNGIKLDKRETLKTLDKKRLKIAMILCLVGILLNFQIIINTLVNGIDFFSLYTMMTLASGGEDTEISSLYNSNLLILQQFVGYPILYMLMPICAAEYFESKEKKYLLIAILLCFLRFMVDLRRAIIVVFVSFIFFYLIIRWREVRKKMLYRRKLTFKKKLFICSIIIIIVTGYSFISYLRGGEDDGYSILSEFYFYYVGCFPYFTRRLELLGDLNYTLGFTSFRGLFAPFFSILSLATGSKPELFELATQNVSSLSAIALEIAPDANYNSYATCFFEFYLDGGVLGIVFFSFIFGMYSHYLFRKLIVFKTNRSMWVYAYFVAIFIYLSVLHFNGLVICYIWPFIIERFLYTMPSKQKLG